MTYLEQLRTEHAERLDRLSRRLPDALPPRVRPKPRIVLFGKDGRRVVPLRFERPAPAPMPMPVIRNGCVTVPQILHVVAASFDIDRRWLTNRTTRLRIVSFPRHVAFYLGMTMTTMSLGAVGRAMGGFDHSTVLNGRNKVARRMKVDEDMAARVQTMRAELWQAAAAVDEKKGEDNGAS